MATVEDLRSIKDVEERARTASEVVRWYEARAKVERSKRDMAAIVLVASKEELPIRVAEMLGVSRGLVFRMLDRVADGDLPKIKDPRGVAIRAARALQRHEEAREEAREIRDEAVMAMLESAQWRNADVARSTGLTTARIAQMRYGRR